VTEAHINSCRTAAFRSSPITAIPLEIDIFVVTLIAIDEFAVIALPFIHGTSAILP